MDQHDDDLDWLYRRGQYADGTDPSLLPKPVVSFHTGMTGRISQADARQAAPRATQPAPTGRAPRVAEAPVAPTPAPAPTASPRPRRRHHVGRWILTLILAFLVYLIAVPLVAWSGVDHVAYAPSGTRPADQPGTLLLLAGSDSREGLTPEQEAKFGTGSEGGNVSDTIMLLYLPPAGGRPVLISIPRDSYVQIPGHSSNKINASFAMGGPQLLAATIEKNTGLRIDGYIGVGFGGFVNIIDSLGGIEQCPTTAVNDWRANLNIQAGCQNMDGITALGYVRYRHADPQGDLGRANRQRSMVSAVAKKAVSPGTILNPIAYTKVNRAGAAALKVGDGTSTVTVAEAAVAFLKVSKGSGVSLTIPVSDISYRSGNVTDAVLWDKTKSQRLFNDIATGNTGSDLDQFATKK